MNVSPNIISNYFTDFFSNLSISKTNVCGQSFNIWTLTFFERQFHSETHIEIRALSMNTLKEMKLFSSFFDRESETLTVLPCFNETDLRSDVLACLTLQLSQFQIYILVFFELWFTILFMINSHLKQKIFGCSNQFGGIWGM